MAKAINSRDYNIRAIGIWTPISRFVDFRGRSVVDLGCGSGDFLRRYHIAGAYDVTGIDRQTGVSTVEINVKSSKLNVKNMGTIRTIKDDLNLMKSEWKADIGVCLSVLPYLEEPRNFTYWMAEQFGVSIIECQYKGDGPGFDFIKDSDDMKRWLLSAFGYATLIGKTYLPPRNLYRDIWMCENDL